MFKIGDFSKLAQVSVKTLRYYDKLGLLNPTWVDRFTGYRYYSVEQLPRLNRILALKDLGFSLDQIQPLLRDDLPAAELRGMMRMKQAEIERNIQAEQFRLERVEARLRQIQQEGAVPSYDVVLKMVSPQRVVGIREVIPGFHHIIHLIDELCLYLKTQRVIVGANCPCMVIYYDGEYRERGIHVEAAVPLSRPMPSTPRTIVHELPGVEEMACVIHQGGYERLPEAYNALMTWIDINGYRVTGPNRDVYLQGPEPEQDMENLVTEVQFPVKKKTIPIFLSRQKEKSDMEPKIVTKPAFTVIGMQYHGKNENNEIAKMWRAFMPRFYELKDIANMEVSYGVCAQPEEDGAFKYVAGFELTGDADIPDGMVSWDVPEQKYAVFPCTLKTIHEAYKYAFETWLPESSYKYAGGFDFEYYDENFDPEVEGSEMYIYVPVK